MTQLFGRSLFIKYYKKEERRVGPEEGQGAAEMPMDSQNEPDPVGEDPPSAGMGDEPGVGFAPADIGGDYFNDLPQLRMEHGLEGMLRKHPGATSGHAMDIDPFRIQTKIDVHRIKADLWSYMHPRLAVEAEDDPEEAASPAAEKPDPDQDASLPNQDPQKGDEESL